jgi:Domain of unknown function (DUF5666)
MTRYLHFTRPRAAWRSAVLVALIAVGCAQVPAPSAPANLPAKTVGGAKTGAASAPTAAPANACKVAAQVNPAASDATVAGRPGIGGTGIDTGGIGGTGIVGVITGFASVCVNGVEVHYDQSTPVASNGALRSASQLVVGQVVLIAAQGQGAQLTARSINAVYAVVGPVQSIDAQRGTLQVMGQQLVDATAAEMDRVQPGQWVQASGHRLANGAVALTSLEPIAALEQARLNGRITRIEPGAVLVESTRVALGAGAAPLPVGAAVGMELSASGVWDGTQLQGQRLDVEPTRKALGSSERVLLQGYVQGLNGRQLSLGHSVITLNPSLQVVGGGTAGLAVNQRVQISGRLGNDQRFAADRVEVQHSGLGSSGSSGKGSGRRGGSDSGSSDSGGSGDDSGKNSGSDSSNSGKGSSGSDAPNSGSGSNSGTDSGSNSGSNSGSGNSGKGSSGSGGTSGGSGGGSSGGGSSGGGSGKGSGGGGKGSGGGGK